MNKKHKRSKGQTKRKKRRRERAARSHKRERGLTPFTVEMPK